MTAADDVAAVLAPRYGAESLADVLPSVCDGLRVPQAWDILGLGPCDRVVVLLVDGLGWHQLRDHADLAPTIAAGATRWITTVTPSTTATALTSLGSGLPAGRHGVVGASFYLPEDDLVLWPLGWRRDVPAAAVAPHPTWWARADRAGVAVSIVSPRAYAGGGLTTAAFGGAPYCGADGPGERVAEVAAAVRSSARALVYTYCEALDRTAHIHGVASRHYRAELAATDRFVAAVLAAMPAGARLVLTADHGVVDAVTDVDVEADPRLGQGVRLIAGEPRLRHVYTARGAATDVAATWTEALGSRAQVMTREQFVATGWLGDVDDVVAGRLGDVVVLANGDTKLSAPSRDSIVSGLKGQHGALTPAEMAVPLAVWDC